MIWSNETYLKSDIERFEKKEDRYSFLFNCIHWQIDYIFYCEYNCRNTKIHRYKRDNEKLEMWMSESNLLHTSSIFWAAIYSICWSHCLFFLWKLWSGYIHLSKFQAVVFKSYWNGWLDRKLIEVLVWMIVLNWLDWKSIRTNWTD